MKSPLLLELIKQQLLDRGLTDLAEQVEELFKQTYREAYKAGEQDCRDIQYNDEDYHGI